MRMAAGVAGRGRAIHQRPGERTPDADQFPRESPCRHRPDPRVLRHAACAARGSGAGNHQTGAGHGQTGHDHRQAGGCRRRGSRSDGGWPRSYTTASGAALVLYQPQISSWADQKHVVAYAAVSYTPKGATKPALGTVKLESDTSVALDERLVSFSELKITESNFPDAPARSAQDGRRRRSRRRCRSTSA